MKNQQLKLIDMRKATKGLAVLMLMMAAVCTTGCNKDGDSDDWSGNNGNSDVRVTTYSPQNITQTSVVCGGDAIVRQGLSLSEFGVCWSKELNPTAEDTHLSTTNWREPYVCTITGLEPGTNYHIRAYALRGLMYYYGEEKSFTTESNGSGSGWGNAPTGAINGRFTINDEGTQVYFSKGNLQYKASTNTWKFAENQIDYIGYANSNVNQNYSGWIDLFGWGTSGWNSGNTYYQPWDTYLSFSSSGSFYGPPGRYNLTGDYANADWGVYNPILNGGNSQNNGWRTPTAAEWDYVFISRPNASSKYGQGNVDGVNGMILLPDDWMLPDGLSFTAGNTSWANVYTAAQWTQMEINGAVFLPAAGSRERISVLDVGTYGYYWSSSYDSSDGAYHLTIGDMDLGAWYSSNRGWGNSVRLIAVSEN